MSKLPGIIVVDPEGNVEKGHDRIRPGYKKVIADKMRIESMNSHADANMDKETNRVSGTAARHKIQQIKLREESLYKETNPASFELHQKNAAMFFNGVPMDWMSRYPRAFPIYQKSAKGAHVTDVDGNDRVDFCLGGCGSLFGYAIPQVVEAISWQMANGASSIMPTEDAYYTAKGMQRIFGLTNWQFTVSASEANRSAIRLSRALTGRERILVFDGCYHGTLDEGHPSRTAEQAYQAGPARSEVIDDGYKISPGTKVVDFNDIDGLEKALADQTVACVLTEPALTNCGLVMPKVGFHEALRELTLKTGTLLIMDETQTIAAGFGGFSRQYDLKSDMMTMGKPMAGGIPVGIYGMSGETASRVHEEILTPEAHHHLGFAGTMAGSPLQLKAARTMLEKVITENNYAKMFKHADALQKGLDDVIASFCLPMCSLRLGARVGFYPEQTPPLNGAQAHRNRDQEFEELYHLYAFNRGIMLSPYRNTAVACPELTTMDTDLHNTIFQTLMAELFE